MEPLSEAIKEVSPDKLRAIVMQVCNASAETRKLFESMMLASDPDTGGEISGNDNKSAIGKKRKLDDGGKKLVPRFHTCLQCEEEFDLLENDEESCVWHTGEREVFEEDGFWDKFDWEEWRDGAYEDHEDDPEFAEGFKWTCCDKNGDDKGCMVTKHNHTTEGVLK